ncbi:hypothetical protein AYO47_02865 [Planctomyces sp. SCGC AG-212-M04]|nr:hypothetical protein AYO47_02865 [Planctomyces sp. SCGC AG-212-M04]
MTESLDRSFGLTIAFLLPGFVCMFGVSHFSPTLTAWMSSEPSRDPSIGGFLYVVMGSMAAGLTVSAVRWAIIDQIHHATGLSLPDFNFSRLTEHLLAFQLAVEHNYRYFQFYANMAVALVVFGVCHQAALGLWSWLGWLGFFGLETVLIAASRDSLGRFYSRVALVLGTRDELVE